MEAEGRTFSQRGGARVGLFNLTWPFVRLTADADQIRLWILVFPMTFPKSSIKRLSLYQLLFSKGLHIEYTAGILPTGVVFWTFNFDKLAESLRELGYTVE